MSDAPEPEIDFRARVAALLKRIAWKGDGQERGMTCPACNTFEYSGDEFQVHAPGCELAALLKECE